MIWINGYQMPSPQHLEITQTDTLGKCQVNSCGNIVRDMLGVKKRITLRYRHLKDEDAKRIYALSDTEANIMFRYPDMDGLREIACRVAGRHMTLFRVEDGKSLWQDAVITLEEV